MGVRKQVYPLTTLTPDDVRPYSSEYESHIMPRGRLRMAENNARVPSNAEIGHELARFVREIAEMGDNVDPELYDAVHRFAFGRIRSLFSKDPVCSEGDWMCVCDAVNLAEVKGKAASRKATPMTPVVVVDLIVADVARLFKRGHSTIRTWIAAGEFPNAYRLHGREWRIPRSDIEAMQRGQSEAAARSSGVVTGEDAERIVDEIRNGTPNTPKRVETIKRARALYASQKAKHAKDAGDDVDLGSWRKHIKRQDG